MTIAKKNIIIRELVKEHGHREFDTSETMKQLVHFGSGRILSWGMSQRFNLWNRGLIFRVNGFHHKGEVLIVLDGSDTYTVFILNNRARVLDKFDNVYFDELFDRIDERIEKVSEYVR